MGSWRSFLFVVNQSTDESVLGVGHGSDGKTLKPIWDIQSVFITLDHCHTTTNESMFVGTKGRTLLYSVGTVLRGKEPGAEDRGVLKGKELGLTAGTCMTICLVPWEPDCHCECPSWVPSVLPGNTDTKRWLCDLRGPARRLPRVKFSRY